MADVVSRQKTAALCIGAALIIVACGEQAAEDQATGGISMSDPHGSLAEAAGVIAAPAADGSATSTPPATAPAAEKR